MMACREQAETSNKEVTGTPSVQWENAATFI